MEDRKNPFFGVIEKISVNNDSLSSRQRNIIGGRALREGNRFFADKELVKKRLAKSLPWLLGPVGVGAAMGALITTGSKGLGALHGGVIGSIPGNIAGFFANRGVDKKWLANRGIGYGPKGVKTISPEAKKKYFDEYDSAKLKSEKRGSEQVEINPFADVMLEKKASIKTGANMEDKKNPFSGVIEKKVNPFNEKTGAKMENKKNPFSGVIEKKAKEGDRMPGYWATQMAAGRASAGKGIFADKELIKKRLSASLPWTVGGAAAGLLGGGAASLLIPRGYKGLGILAGGAAGMAGGSIAGNIAMDKVDDKWIADRGITRNWWNTVTHMTPEAKQKYLHEKYEGGGWKRASEDNPFSSIVEKEAKVNPFAKIAKDKTNPFSGITEKSSENAWVKEAAEKYSELFKEDNPLDKLANLLESN